MLFNLKIQIALLVLTEDPKIPNASMLSYSFTINIFLGVFSKISL